MWLREKKFSIYITGSTWYCKLEKLWYAEWGYTVIFSSHGTNDARGVCILLKNDFEHEIHEIIRDEEGRYIILDISINQKRITLANIYGNNIDTPKLYENFIEIIENMPNDHRIIGGNHNVVIDVVKDKKEAFRKLILELRIL